MAANGSTLPMRSLADQPPQGIVPLEEAYTPETPSNAPTPPRRPRLTLRISTGGIAPRKPEVAPGPLGTHKMRTRSRVCKRAHSHSKWSCKQCMCWESFEMLP